MTGLDLEEVREALEFVSPDDRETWVRMAMAVKSEYADAGFETWDQWGQGSASHNAKDARDVWKSIRSDGRVTLGSLVMAAKAGGWTDDGVRHRPTQEELEERQRSRAERAMREAEALARDRAATADKATRIWRSASPARSSHPYLTRKQVHATQTMREIDAEACAKILGYVPTAGGEELKGSLLVLPIKIGGELSSCELIDEVGLKTALSGRGTKSGGFWATEALPATKDAEARILIGEGAATTLAASLATRCPGVAALSAGNLAKVANALRTRYPQATIIVLADVDKATGEPDPRAKVAATEARALLAAPRFEAGASDTAKDMNDLYRLEGQDAVLACIDRANLPEVLDVPAERTGFVPGIQPWPAPKEILGVVEAPPYPIDALPPTIREAVAEVADFVKAPIALVASSAIAAVSVAVQAHVDVQRAPGLLGPTGLFLLTIADSGERKSTCDGFFTRPIRDFEATSKELGKTLARDHRADIEAWESKRAGIKERLRQHAKDSKPTDDLELALRQLEAECPEAPRIPRLLYADATPEALAYGLAKHWPSGGVVSAEAGVVFGSHGMGKESVMRNLAQLNQLWDGNSLTIDRRTSESFTVTGARLTVALQIQEATLRTFFERSGGLARGTGFLARFLVAWPTSTQGLRPFSEPPARWPSLEAFHRRLIDLLEQPSVLTDAGGLLPQVVELDEIAKAAWVAFYDQIEAGMQIGGELEDVRDVASKTADNAARLAALFQAFEGGAAPIREEYFEGASRIAAWHLNEARRFFGEMSLSPAELQALRLDHWLRESCSRQGATSVPASRVLQYGPGATRGKDQVETAVKHLEALGRARWVHDGRRRAIAVNPVLIGDARAV